MTKDSEVREFKGILRDVDKRLGNIEKILDKLDSRISKLEDSRSSQQASQENPLLYSRALMGTLNAIREYERENRHGVVAKKLARIRNLEPPTIYDHLSKLEEANLIFWQRGAEINLKPHNAKFYSVSERDELLADLPVLMSIPDRYVPIAQSILKATKKGASRKSLIEYGRSLIEQNDEHWENIRSNDVTKEIDKALYYLLQRVLIRRERTEEQDIYFAYQ